MTRSPSELTPKQVISLRKLCSSLDLFKRELSGLGYHRNDDGVSKVTYRRSHGFYVVKVADTEGYHTDGLAIMRRYKKHRARGGNRLLPTLAATIDVHVQRYVHECGCAKGIRGYADSRWHNHTHTSRGPVMFDY